MSRHQDLFRGALILLLIYGATPNASGQKWDRYGPGTRSQATAVYDPSTNQMILFGGQHAPASLNFNDVWSVKNVVPSSSSTSSSLAWVKVLTVQPQPPSPRFGHTAVYNQTTNRMIVFGGGTGFPGPCANDLWVLKNANSMGGVASWLKQTPTGTLPGVRQGHTAVYDPGTNTMIVFGGTDCNGNYYSDLWILSNADGSNGTPSWRQASPLGVGPGARTQATAVYDSVNNVMTVFAGATAVTNPFNDVFRLTNANAVTGVPTWTQLSPTGTAPSARGGHSAIYDSTNGRMVIYGGSDNQNIVLNDTWILTGVNGIGGTPAWTQLLPTASAPFRKSHTVIYDPVSDDMVIFGGDSQLPQSFTDDHVLILTHANGL